MEQYSLNPIGKICVSGGETRLELAPAYAPALEGLDGFGYVQVLWWFDRCDTPQQRAILTERQPYVRGPGVMGTFATRSPQRPNPIALSTAYVTCIDHSRAAVGLAYIDAADGSPLLDIKPYTPSLDRAGTPAVPGWCAHWPGCLEDSGGFGWESEFNF